MALLDIARVRKLLRTRCPWYVYKYEIGCRDDTVPKTVDTKGTARRSESMQQSSATPKNQDVGIGLRKIVAYSRSAFLYLQFLAQCHPYILLCDFFNTIYLCL